jgi:multidrug efflux pump subunit AcrA (membrane-fusion protein)
MVATVVFRKENRAYLLPLTAVAQGLSSQEMTVFRVEDEGGRSIIRQIPIAFDDVLDNKIAVRISEAGLKAGDRVVATGVHRLREGQAVRVVE